MGQPSILKGMSQMPQSKLGLGTWAIEPPVLHLTISDQTKEKILYLSSPEWGRLPHGLPHSSPYKSTTKGKRGLVFRHQIAGAGFLCALYVPVLAFQPMSCASPLIFL
jgi:hypothetical protein